MTGTQTDRQANKHRYTYTSRYGHVYKINVHVNDLGYYLFKAYRKK